MLSSIATVSLSGDLHDKIEAAAEAGFDGIEIFEQDFIADIDGPKAVARRIRDAGLEIFLFQPFRDFEGLPPALRAKAFDRAERKFDLMQELGCDLILVCSSVHPEALGGIDRAADDFRELGERAAKRGLRVSYEALAWGRHVNDHRDAWEIVRRADHPNVGLVLDSFHTLARGIDPESIRRIPGDKIFFLQLADAPGVEMDLLYRSRHFRNMPGEGDLPVLDFMRAVVAAGYTGPVSLEIFNDQFRGGNPRFISRDGYRSLVCLMDDVRRSEPDAAVDLPDMPGRSDVTGVAFIEFTSRGEEADVFEALLATLGFRHTARHIQKDVRLWSQGDVRILVNRETTGFAASAYTMHGTSVCDICLAVSDAADAVARAQAMGVNPFSQPRGPEELDIPAIRGVGGSVLHFIDDKGPLADIWGNDFRPVDGAEAAAEPILQRVDHLAQTMQYDEMLSWALFYTSLFTMEKTPMLDVVDPDGLIRSQAIAAHDRAFRITLNGTETHRTLAGEFLAESFGGSVQHIALATDDIFSAAERLAADGFEPLPISANYYDDLAARFDLAPDLLARLKGANILYDADDNGEFFQFYSPTFAGGAFFEIVERRGGYDGYGAPNAPFRIAAQKRFVRSQREMER